MFPPFLRVYRCSEEILGATHVGNTVSRSRNCVSSGFAAIHTAGKVCNATCYRVSLFERESDRGNSIRTKHVELPRNLLLNGRFVFFFNST